MTFVRIYQLFTFTFTSCGGRTVEVFLRLEGGCEARSVDSFRGRVTDVQHSVYKTPIKCLPVRHFLILCCNVNDILSCHIAYQS